jgi:hypothetical protein
LVFFCLHSAYILCIVQIVLRQLTILEYLCLLELVQTVVQMMVDLVPGRHTRKGKKVERLLCIKFYLKLFSFLGTWYYDFFNKA